MNGIASGIRLRSTYDMTNVANSRKQMLHRSLILRARLAALFSRRSCGFLEEVHQVDVRWCDSHLSQDGHRLAAVQRCVIDHVQKDLPDRASDWAVQLRLKLHHPAHLAIARVTGPG